MATGPETSLDPLDLGERIIAILQQGQKLSTYKLATLSALIEVPPEKWTGVMRLG